MKSLRTNEPRQRATVKDAGDMNRSAKQKPSGNAVPLNTFQSKLMDLKKKFRE